MTERKPPRARYESWVDRQVREGIDRGDFENLPGTGKPISDLGTVHDELWWVKQKLQRENIAILPPTLALRKEAQDARRAAAAAESELSARHILTEINDKIRAFNIRPVAGPPANLAPFNIERIIDRWRADHPAPAATEGSAPGPTTYGADNRKPPGPRWRRIGRRSRQDPAAPAGPPVG